MTYRDQLTVKVGGNHVALFEPQTRSGCGRLKRDDDIRLIRYVKSERFNKASNWEVAEISVCSAAQNLM